VDDGKAPQQPDISFYGEEDFESIYGATPTATTKVNIEQGHCGKVKKKSKVFIVKRQKDMRHNVLRVFHKLSRL
jgi:hypothetical protein